MPMNTELSALQARVPGLFPQQGNVLYGITAARYGSPHHALTLAGATLVFYTHDGVFEKGALRRPRWGFQPADEESISAPELGRATVADDGSYRLLLEDIPSGLILVAVSVEKFAYAPATGKRVFGLLGVAAPEWQGDGTSQRAALHIDLPHNPYCSILEGLDLWLVAGRVTDCGNDENPLPNGTVEAYDRDLTQDDYLGSAVTDAGGNFQIFFQSAAFKGIPVLPPPWDVIPPHELIGGPDVFFRVLNGATPLMEEPPSRGRTDGRENVGHCSFHELCVKAPALPPVQTVTLWSHIGNFMVPDGGGLHDFDADGLTASGKEAFTGALDFNGQLSQKYAGQAVSFRFVFAEWTSPAVAPSYPADYQPLLDTHINLNAPYGALYTSTGPDPWDYTLTPVLPAPDGAGWIAVDQSSNFIRNVSRLVQVRSNVLVPPVADLSTLQGTADAGLPVPAGPLRDRPRKFSFVLEIRTASLSAHQSVPVSVHINNSAAYLRYNLTELESNACSPLTESAGAVTVHPKFTVAHPYLQSFSINVQRQDASNLVVRDESYTSHSVLWTDTDGESGTETAVYTDVGPCSYRSSIVAHRRLTNGYGGPGHQHVLRTFCVE